MMRKMMIRKMVIVINNSSNSNSNRNLVKRGIGMGTLKVWKSMSLICPPGSGTFLLLMMWCAVIKWDAVLMQQQETLHSAAQSV